MSNWLAVPGREGILLDATITSPEIVSFAATSTVNVSTTVINTTLVTQFAPDGTEFCVSLRNETYCGFIAGNTGALTIPASTVASLPDGTSNVFVEVAGRFASVAIAVDRTAPSAPSVNALSTTDTTPILRGTYDVADGDIATITTTVNGISHTATFADGVWTVQIPDADALVVGQYPVSVTVTDNVNNVTTGSGSISIDDPTPAITGFRFVRYSSSSGELFWDRQTGRLFEVRRNGSVIAAQRDGNSLVMNDLPDGDITFEIRRFEADGSKSDPATLTVLAATTAPGTPTFVSQPSALETDQGIVVTWAMSENITGVVDYGPTSAMGFSTPAEESFLYDGHNQLIVGFTGSVLHYRVRGEDSDGNAYASAAKTLLVGVSASATKQANGTVQATLSLPVNAPAQLQYREEDATAWIDRLPAENSSDFDGHLQAFPGIEGGTLDLTKTYEWRWIDHINGSFKTQVQSIDLAATATGGSGSPSGPYVPPTSFGEIRLTRNAENGTDRTHAYSRKRAFNADETKILLVQSGQGVIVDLNGTQIGATSGVREWDWHTSDPDILFACSGSDVVMIRVSTGQVTSLWSGPAGLTATIGTSEGAIAANRYAVITGPDQNAVGSTMYAVDLMPGAFLGDQPGVTLGTAPMQSGHDWIAYDRRANHIVSNAFDPVETTQRSSFIYDTDLTNLRKLSSVDGHADFVVDQAGDDWLVNFSNVTAVRLRDGFERSLGYAKGGHISALATAAPDWYWQSDASNIIARSVEPGSPVVSWGNTDTTDSSYYSQAQGTISPSGKRFLYTSVRSGTNEDYLITGT